MKKLFFLSIFFLSVFLLTVSYGNACRDNDGDGYYMYNEVDVEGTCGPVDCDDTNYLFYPSAIEICSDNLDSDCDGYDNSQDCSDGIPVYRGAEGFGVYTPAGSGGSRYSISGAFTPASTVYKINNLSPDSGNVSCSNGICINATLADCIHGDNTKKASADPRVCVFETSGYIDFGNIFDGTKGSMTIIKPFITIAGQTAPEPGITLKNATLNIETHDVLIQHLRVRVGDIKNAPPFIPNSLRSGFRISAHEDTNSNNGYDDRNNVYNVVIDHCSVSWAQDDNITIGGYGDGPINDIKNITVSNSIMSEGLLPHSAGMHSYSSGLPIDNISVINNLFAHNMIRNPLINANSSTFIANNLIYNSGQSIIFGALLEEEPLYSSVVGNVMIPGPDAVGQDGRPKKILFDISDYDDWHREKGIPYGSSVYLSDNYYPDSPYVTNQWGMTDQCYAVTPPADCPIRAETYPENTLLPSFNIKTHEAVEDYVLSRSGARRKDNDPVDTRIIDNVRNSKMSDKDDRSLGRIIACVNYDGSVKCEKNAGGWPYIPTNIVAPYLDLSNPNYLNADGYTNLEKELQRLSVDVEYNEEYCNDSDGDGYFAEGGYCGLQDCNDADIDVNPNAAEICDGIDNDCDGQTDEGIPLNTYYLDADSDGYGDPTESLDDCYQITNFVTNNLDCNDRNAAINPGANEICDNVDNDCDGQTDEGTNTDNDGISDICDLDDDNDSVLDVSDNCPVNSNILQTDTDGDGIGDLCDNCQMVSNNQTDFDNDGMGDACDSCMTNPALTCVSTITWDGSESTNWNDPNNWDLGIVPNSGDTVIIPDVTNDPMLDISRTINTLTINTGGSLNLNGKSLTVNGNVTVSGTLNASTGTPTITARGNWNSSASATAFNYGQSTVKFTGTNTTVNPYSSGTFGGTRFYNVIVEGGVTTQSSFMIGNDLTIGVSPAYLIVPLTKNVRLGRTGSLRVRAGGKLTLNGSFWKDTSDDSNNIANNGHIINEGTIDGGGYFAWRIMNNINGTPSTNAPVTATTYNVPVYIGSPTSGGRGVLGPQGATFTTNKYIGLADPYEPGTTILDNSVNNVTINSTGNMFVVGNATTFIAGSASYTVPKMIINASSQLDAGASTWNVTGNWQNSGTFTYGESTVKLTGTDQSLIGSTTFYNLEKTVTASRTLTFEAATTQTVTHLLTLKGVSNNLLSLRSSASSTRFNLNLNGSQSLESLDVKDSNASGGVLLHAGTTSFDSDNNINWDFDSEAPVIIITTPSQNAQYLLNQAVVADWSVTDGGSGVASSSGTVPDGSLIDIVTVGSRSFTVSATDNASNNASQTVSYSIRYASPNTDFFLPPIENNRIFKLGSTIPIKFQLTDANGAYVSTAVASLALQQYSNDEPIGETIDVVPEGGSDSGNLFRYSMEDNQYIYNLRTDNLSKGTWQIRVILNDGSLRTIYIRLKDNQ